MAAPGSAQRPRPPNLSGAKLVCYWLQAARAAQYDVVVLAMAHHVSLRTLERWFQRQFARSPKELVNEWRLLDARNDLREGKPIKVIAREFRFHDTPHFTRVFGACHEVPPALYLALTLRRRAGTQPR
jgi:transcriptional regulator GlxA family with amidase domain